MIFGRKRVALIASVVVLAMTGVSWGADKLPDDLAQKLMALIQGATGKEIPPGIYDLAGQNVPYSDEIACITVQFFGQPNTVQDEILKVVEPDPQRKIVIEAIHVCSQQDIGGGYGAVAANFNAGMAGGGFNTLPASGDDASPITP